MKHLIILLIIAGNLCLLSCKKSTDKQVPLIVTLSPTALGDLDIEAKARIYADGGTELTEAGFCWSDTKLEPDLNDEHVSVTVSGSVFTHTLVNLKEFKNYFVRAYAKNKYGITYGTTENVNSGPPPATPIFGSNDLTKLTTNSATFTFEIPGNFGKLTDIGAFWNTAGSPSVSDNKATAVSTGSNQFICTISNLEPDQVLFVNLFAKSKGGIGFSGEYAIKTCHGTMQDQQGNTYFTTIINGKEWMAENLRATSFRDGQNIQLVQLDYEWYYKTSPAYCYQENNPDDGLYYNYHAIKAVNNIAPVGWHVPSNNEFLDLYNYFKGNFQAGLALQHPKADLWANQSAGPKPTAFFAKFNGYRSQTGFFDTQGSICGFGTSTNYSSDYFTVANIFNASGANNYAYHNSTGVSLRLVKD